MGDVVVAMLWGHGLHNEQDDAQYEETSLPHFERRGGHQPPVAEGLRRLERER